eukprot:176842-Prorocentrum_lima.AAC.1
MPPPEPGRRKMTRRGEAETIDSTPPGEAMSTASASDPSLAGGTAAGFGGEDVCRHVRCEDLVHVESRYFRTWVSPYWRRRHSASRE